MLISGLIMVNADLPRADQFQLYQTHKAAGVVMLVAIFLRVAIRLWCKPPVLPSTIPPKEKSLATLGHIGLYTMLLAIPISGWVMVSASPFGLPTFVFVDWLKWPHIPGIAKNKPIESWAKLAHWYLVLTMGLMLLAHIGAVIWHKRSQGINLLQRMWWTK